MIRLLARSYRAFLFELWNHRFEPPGATRYPTLVKAGKFHN